MDESVTKVLESIGLYKNEVLIYSELIKLSKASALELSKKTGVHRSNTYTALSNLVNKGLVSEIVEENKKFFRALPVKELKSYVKHLSEQREKDVEEIVKKLNSSSRENSYDEEGVEIFEELFSAKEAVKDIMHRKEKVYGFGVSNEFIDRLGEAYIDELLKKRASRGLETKFIVHEDIKDNKVVRRGNFGEVFVSGEYWSPVTTLISGDDVFIFVFSSPLHVIRIRNREVAKSYKNYFELMWKKPC